MGLSGCYGLGFLSLRKYTAIAAMIIVTATTASKMSKGTPGVGASCTVIVWTSDSSGSVCSSPSQLAFTS